MGELLKTEERTEGGKRIITLEKGEREDRTNEKQRRSYGTFSTEML